ncbi:glutamic acid-rich protein-like [Impatiens glandulifera]|uniref:glutamic acid-rich protein-like n=1 Tax=Impatiens glandulifera TaxID=253017 RepID=UPI001FB0BA61|nr:glutamic acid-rich protein-like [Impatiens glandulifera]
MKHLRELYLAKKKTWEKKSICDVAYTLHGFALAFQVWTYELINTFVPKFAERTLEDDPTSPRIVFYKSFRSYIGPEVSTAIQKCNVRRKIHESEEEKRIQDNSHEIPSTTTPLPTDEDNSTSCAPNRVSQAHTDAKIDELTNDVNEIKKDVNEIKSEIKLIKENQQLIITLLGEIKEQKNSGGEEKEEADTAALDTEKRTKTRTRTKTKNNDVALDTKRRTTKRKNDDVDNENRTKRKNDEVMNSKRNNDEEMKKSKQDDVDEIKRKMNERNERRERLANLAKKRKADELAKKRKADELAKKRELTKKRNLSKKRSRKRYNCTPPRTHLSPTHTPRTTLSPTHNTTPHDEEEEEEEDEDEEEEYEEYEEEDEEDEENDEEDESQASRKLNFDEEKDDDVQDEDSLPTPQSSPKLKEVDEEKNKEKEVEVDVEKEVEVEAEKNKEVVEEENKEEVEEEKNKEEEETKENDKDKDFPHVLKEKKEEVEEEEETKENDKDEDLPHVPKEKKEEVIVETKEEKKKEKNKEKEVNDVKELTPSQCVNPMLRIDKEKMKTLKQWLNSDDKYLKDLTVCEADRSLFNRLLKPQEWLHDVKIANRYDMFAPNPVGYKFDDFMEYVIGEGSNPWNLVDMIYVPLNLKQKHWVLCQIHL